MDTTKKSFKKLKKTHNGQNWAKWKNGPNWAKIGKNLQKLAIPKITYKWVKI